MGTARAGWPGPGPGWPDDGAHAEAAQAVTALHKAHAVGLIRLAVVMLGDRAAAEDVVQDAFCGLYRRRGQLAGPARALGVRARRHPQRVPDRQREALVQRGRLICRETRRGQQPSRRSDR
jgi:hypothetical protein